VTPVLPRVQRRDRVRDRLLESSSRRRPGGVRPRSMSARVPVLRLSVTHRASDSWEPAAGRRGLTCHSHRDVGPGHGYLASEPVGL
jgi:hypothetical protein